jgi:hypothetical protein
MTENAAPLYPPIARQAHITGMVILLATFDLDGTVTSTTILRGPEMLKGAAAEYVRHWKANSYTGPRQCPLVIAFGFFETPPCTSSSDTRIKRVDVQHTTVSTAMIWICDPVAHIVKRRKLSLFF